MRATPVTAENAKAAFAAIDFYSLADGGYFPRPARATHGRLTPHARRHLPRLARRGFTFILEKEACLLAPKQENAEGLEERVEYRGRSLAQAVAVATGHGPGKWSWNRKTGAESASVLTYQEPTQSNRRRSRGRATARLPSRVERELLQFGPEI
jgi:hypothetical protein